MGIFYVKLHLGTSTPVGIYITGKFNSICGKTLSVDILISAAFVVNVVLKAHQWAIGTGQNFGIRNVIEALQNLLHHEQPIPRLRSPSISARRKTGPAQNNKM